MDKAQVPMILLSTRVLNFCALRIDLSSERRDDTAAVHVSGLQVDLSSERRDVDSKSTVELTGTKLAHQARAAAARGIS